MTKQFIIGPFQIGIGWDKFSELYLLPTLVLDWQSRHLKSITLTLQFLKGYISFMIEWRRD